MACEVVQRLIIQKTGQLLLSVTVRIPPQSTNPAMMLHLPHGLFLPDGVLLDVDGKSPKKHDVQTCDQKGCYVGLALDGDTLKSLQTGQAMTIAFHNLQKEPVRIAVLLSGFGEAYKKLQQ
jgi:invasion protein IalB